MPTFGDHGARFTKDFKARNRNRFIVDYLDNMWNVYRISHRGGVRLIVQCHEKVNALALATMLNGWFENQEII